MDEYTSYNNSNVLMDAENIDNNIVTNNNNDDDDDDDDASAYQNSEQMDDYSSYNASSSNITNAEDIGKNDNRSGDSNNNDVSYHSPTQQQRARGGGHSPIQKLNSLLSSPLFSHKIYSVVSYIWIIYSPPPYCCIQLFKWSFSLLLLLLLLSSLFFIRSFACSHSYYIRQ
jgi:hypothetical protein